MNDENIQPTPSPASMVVSTHSRSWRVKVASGCIAAGLLAVLVFAYATKSAERADPLTPTEEMLIGSWVFPTDSIGQSTVVSFHADRTCEYNGMKDRYPSRWRIIDSSLIIQHKYQTFIGQLPVPMPGAISNFELPSFMAHKETFLRSMSISEDGRMMTLGPLFPGQPDCNLVRTSTADGAERECSAKE